MTRSSDARMRRRRARVVALVATLALAVVGEPALALLGSSGFALCPCDHEAAEHVTEIVPEPQADEMPCHEMNGHEMNGHDMQEGGDAEPAVLEPVEVASGVPCFEPLCPHCSSDQPRSVTTLRGVFEPPHDFSTLSFVSSVAPAPDSVCPEGVVCEVFHVPIV